MFLPILILALLGAPPTDPRAPGEEIVLIGIGGKGAGRDAERHLHAAWRCGLKKAYLRPQRAGDFPDATGSSIVLAVPRERSRTFERRLACYGRQPETGPGLLA